jgi:predicted dehydrogenase
MRECGDFLSLVAVADVQQELINKVDLPRVAKFADHRQMLDSCDLDAVYIATLAGVREAIAIDAIDAGLHVMCEKPMAADSDACRRINEAAKAAKRVVGVNFEMRFYDWVVHINEWIAQGMLGRVEAIHMQELWDGHKAFGPSSQRRRRLIDVAGALDCGIHRADLARSFAGGGEWQRVEAQGAWFDETSTLPPHITVLATLDSGAYLSLTSSFAYTAYIKSIAYQEIMTVVGTKGIIHVVEGTDRKIHVELVCDEVSQMASYDMTLHSRIIPRVLREFTARIEGMPHDGILALGEDGLAAQQFIERANASALAHRA